MPCSKPTRLTPKQIELLNDQSRSDPKFRQWEQGLPDNGGPGSGTPPRGLGSIIDSMADAIDCIIDDAGGGASGFYGINVAETDDTPSFKGINTVKFDSFNFYIVQNDPNTDEVQVFLRNLPGASGGEANTASNLGTGAGVFAQKVGVDLQFKSLVAGSETSITSTATEITINSTSGPGFYGLTVKESDNTNVVRSDTLIFTANDFDVTNSASEPLVSLATNVARLSDIGPGFYGIVVEESDGSNSLRDDTVRFLNTDFDVSNVNNKPQIALSTNVAHISDIGPGFYGIIVEESDGSNTIRDDTIRFLATDFDVSNVNNKPQVALSAAVAHISDIGPGFYGITVAELDGTPTFRGINTIKFNNDFFYIEDRKSVV